MKKAYLVYFTVGTRVIVEDGMSDDGIIKAACDQLMDNMKEDGIGSYICPDNAEWDSPIEDNEMPYNPKYDD